MTSRPPQSRQRRPRGAAGAPRRSGEAVRTGAWIACAAALHLLGVVVVTSLPRRGPATRQAVVPTLSAAGQQAAVGAARRALAEARRPERARPPAPVQPPKPQPPPDRQRGQVVSLPPDADRRRPKPNERLAQHDAYADKETVAKNPAPGAANVMHERTVTQRGKARTDAPPEGRVQAPRPEATAPEAPEATQKGRARVFELPEQRARERLVLRQGRGREAPRNHEAAPAVQGNAERLRVDVGAEGEPSDAPAGGPRRTLTMQDLVPDAGVLARVAGAPAPDDVRNVAKGEGTFLNAHGYRYASFFNRLQAKVASVWRPQDEVRRRDPTGNIYGSEDRTTLVYVSLNESGGLEKLVLQESCGLAFLDQAALDAMRRAAPFLHPPRGLPDADGLVNFSFGFRLSTEPMSAFGAGF